MVNIADDRRQREAIREVPVTVPPWLWDCIVHTIFGREYMFNRHSDENYHPILDGIGIKTLVYGKETLMVKNIVIRDEIASDADSISEVTKAAFATCPHGSHTEQFIVGALREAGALTISLVAEAGRKIVGHIAFSPVAVSDGRPGWYGLGPISVLPELQKRGIGRSLMREGLSRLRALGAAGCVLVGDPGYYERFGFRSFPDLAIDGVPRDNVLALPFQESKISGTVTFHEGFAAQG